jgi:hypothetical protein
MRASTITAQEFLTGRAARVRNTKTIHNFKAHLEGRGIKVVDEYGNPVEVRFAGTTDNRSCSASIDGLGLIGGWQYPHKAMPWKYMVESINRGILYSDMNGLPTAYRRTA